MTVSYVQTDCFWKFSQRVLINETSKIPPFTCLGLYIAKTTWNLFVFQCLYKIPAQDNILCGDIFIQLDFWYPFGDIAGNQRRPWLSCDLQKPNYRASSVKDRKETSFWHKSGFHDSWCWKLCTKFLIEDHFLSHFVEIFCFDQKLPRHVCVLEIFQ